MEANMAKEYNPVYDLNADGIIDDADVDILKHYMSMVQVDYTDPLSVQADFNGDGVITGAELSMLFDYHGAMSPDYGDPGVWQRREEESLQANIDRYEEMKKNLRGEENKTMFLVGALIFGLVLMSGNKPKSRRRR